MSCSDCGTSALKEMFRPQKVYFFWQCRDEQEFGWFNPLLKELEEDESFGNVFELNTFMTGELNLEEMVAKIQQGKKPLSMKYAGRPNWNRIFKGVKASHPDEDIGVFLCGPDEIAKALDATCRSFSSSDETSFTFHKENF
jgi:NADPH oxidase